MSLPPRASAAPRLPCDVRITHTPLNAFQGRVLWFKFEGNANDSSGYGHNFNANNAPTYEAGKVDQAIRFNGTTQYLSQFFTAANAITLKTKGSYAVWLKPDSVSGNKQIYERLNDVHLRLVGGNVEFILTGIATAITTGAPVAAGAWSYVVATYDGAFVRIYVNGVLKAQVAGTGSMAGNANQTGIGGGTTADYYAGLMDELEVFQTALTQEEVDLRYGTAAIEEVRNRPAQKLRRLSIRKTQSVNSPDGVVVLKDEGNRFKSWKAGAQLKVELRPANKASWKAFEVMLDRPPRDPSGGHPTITANFIGWSWLLDVPKLQADKVYENDEYTDIAGDLVTTLFGSAFARSITADAAKTPYLRLPKGISARQALDTVRGALNGGADKWEHLIDVVGGAKRYDLYKRSAVSQRTVALKDALPGTTWDPGSILEVVNRATVLGDTQPTYVIDKRSLTFAAKRRLTATATRLAIPFKALDAPLSTVSLEADKSVVADPPTLKGIVSRNGHGYGLVRTAGVSLGMLPLSHHAGINAAPQLTDGRGSHESGQQGGSRTANAGEALQTIAIYDFGANPPSIEGFSIDGSGGNSTTQEVEVAYSDDNVTYTAAVTFTVGSDATKAVFFTAQKKRYWRVRDRNTDAGNNYTFVYKEMTFLGYKNLSTDITNPERLQDWSDSTAGTLSTTGGGTTKELARFDLGMARVANEHTSAAANEDTLISDGKKVAQKFTAPAAGEYVDAALFRIGVASGSGVGEVEVRLESDDGGNPSGRLLAPGLKKKRDLGTPANGSDHLFLLEAGYTIPGGTVYHVVVIAKGASPAGLRVAGSNTGTVDQLKKNLLDGAGWVLASVDNMYCRVGSLHRIARSALRHSETAASVDLLIKCQVSSDLGATWNDVGQAPSTTSTVDDEVPLQEQPFTMLRWVAQDDRPGGSLAITVSAYRVEVYPQTDAYVCPFHLPGSTSLDELLGSAVTWDKTALATHPAMLEERTYPAPRVAVANGGLHWLVLSILAAGSATSWWDLRAATSGAPVSLSKLLVYLSFDELWSSGTGSLVWRDGSGNGNHTTTGAGIVVSYPGGKAGPCAFFDGTGANNARLEIPSSATMRDCSTGITIAGWFRFTEIRAAEERHYDHLNRHVIGKDVNGKPFFEITKAGGGTLRVTGTTTLQANTWYHICGTHDPTGASRMRIYVNGVEEASAATADNLDTTSATTMLGSIGSKALIDELYVFGRNLTAAEVTALKDNLTADRALMSEDSGQSWFAIAGPLTFKAFLEFNVHQLEGFAEDLDSQALYKDLVPPDGVLAASISDASLQSQDAVDKEAAFVVKRFPRPPGRFIVVLDLDVSLDVGKPITIAADLAQAMGYGNAAFDVDVVELEHVIDVSGDHPVATTRLVCGEHYPDDDGALSLASRRSV